MFRWTLAALSASILCAAIPVPVAIKDAHVITANGADLPKATVVLRGGLIESVGANVAIPADAWVIEGTGLTVYPGFIDGVSTWGIASAAPPPNVPRGAARAVGTTPTQSQSPPAPRSHGPEDRPQTYSYQRAADEVSPSDSRLQAARDAGYTSAATFPNKGIVEGEGALIDLAGERGRDMVVAQPIGQQIVLRNAGFRAGFPNSLMGDIAYVRQLYLDLQNHHESSGLYKAHVTSIRRPEYDHDLEGLAESPRLLLPADQYQQIDRMIAFGKELRQPFALYGVHEAYERIDQIAQANIPVFVSLKWPEKPKEADPTSTPNYRDLVMRDRAPAVPSLLAKAHVKWAFFSDNITSAADLRKAIRKAVQAGLSEQDAVLGLTRNVAEIYGVADRIGAIEPGKIANLVVSKGDIFDEKSKIQFVFIDGQQFEPAPEEKHEGGEKK